MFPRSSRSASSTRLKRRRTLEDFLPRHRETRRLALAAAGLFAGSVVVTLIVMLAAGRFRHTVAGDRPPELTADVRVGGPAAGGGAPGVEIGVGDLILPETGLGVTTLRQEPGPRDWRMPQLGTEGMPPYMLRRPMSSWSDEQVRRFWIPLETIAIERIVAENDRRIDEMFEEVP